MSDDRTTPSAASDKGNDLQFSPVLPMWSTNITLLDLANITLTDDDNDEEQQPLTIYDDYKDILWPSLVGLIVALALGWMICRYKCSSTEGSPHLVQCCPKSCCRCLRRCCQRIFKSNKKPVASVDTNRSVETVGQELSLRVADSNSVDCPEPKAYPLRRESCLPALGNEEGRRLSDPQWPFQSTSIDFHGQASEMRATHLFFRT